MIINGFNGFYQFKGVGVVEACVYMLHHVQGGSLLPVLDLLLSQSPGENEHERGEKVMGKYFDVKTWKDARDLMDDRDQLKG